jgi:hypothetical protein
MGNLHQNDSAVPIRPEKKLFTRKYILETAIVHR